MTITIATKFSLYQAAVISPQAGPDQRRETQMAFYAGAEAVFQILMAAAADDKSEAEGEAVMQDLSTELREFAHTMVIKLKAQMAQAKKAGL